MSLDQLIEPEITVGSELGLFLESLAARPDVHSILEIGSSSGDGSTQCFVNGMEKNPSHPFLVCIELSHRRYDALCQRYADNAGVNCLQGCTVPPETWMTDDEVSRFYLTHKTNLNQYPLEQVLGWKTKDLKYLKMPQMFDGFNVLKQAKQILAPETHFDLVLIDGSAFTASAELDEVIGAKILCLDDVQDCKNNHNYHRLKSDPRYRLVRENPNLRNGYAVFEKIV